MDIEMKQYILKCKDCGTKSGDIRKDPHSHDGWAGSPSGEHRCPECVEKRIQANAERANREQQLRAKYSFSVSL